MEKKAEYEAPSIVEVGSFEEITRQSTMGTKLDDGFDAGTPLVELTLS